MYFTIESASGGYRTRIFGGNGEQMFISEVYTTKQSAIHAANVVQSGAASAKIYDRT